MSFDLSSANLEKLRDDSYTWYLQEYAAQPTFYQEVFRTTPPMGFDKTKPYHRAQVGVMDTDIFDRTGPNAVEGMKYSGAFEDYVWQIVRREKAFARVIDDDILEAGQAKTINFIQESIRLGAERMAAIKDQHAADMLNYGMLTTATAASKKVWENSYHSRTNTFIDPSGSAGMCYDGLPFFDTAHPQSRIVTGTTYINHSTTAIGEFTRTDLQDITNTMRDTNAYDRNGNRIIITPNTIVYPPSLAYTIEPIMKSSVVDADMRPLVVASKFPWKFIEWPRLTNASGYFVMERQTDLIFIDQWKPTKTDIWYDNENKVWKVSVQEWFGAGAHDWRHSYCANVDAS
jgi:hypothetical protein